MSDTAMGCYHFFFSPSTRASFLRGDFETHFEWPAAQVNDSRLLLKRHSYQSCKRHCPLVALQWLLLPTTVQLRQAKPLTRHVRPSDSAQACKAQLMP